MTRQGEIERDMKLLRDAIGKVRRDLEDAALDRDWGKVWAVVDRLEWALAPERKRKRGPDSGT